MKVFVCPNNRTEDEIIKAQRCIEILENICGHSCSCFDDTFKSLFNGKRTQSFSPSESDLIVSLGGDGSVLRAAKVAIECSKPLLGINSGRLGYLCAIDYDNLANFNKALETSKLTQRSILSLNYDGKETIAINDIIVAKKNFGATVDLTVTIDNQLTRKIRGDGLVVATPTGSTAYNYSTGGPEIAYDVPCFALTTICPHDAGQKSYVVNDSKVISVSERNDMAELYCDGVNVGTINGSVTISKSRVYLNLYSK